MLSWTEHDIEPRAKSSAQHAKRIIARNPDSSPAQIYQLLIKLTDGFNLIPPKPNKIDPPDSVADDCKEEGSLKAGQLDYGPAIRRLCCKHWWLRSLRRAVIQTQEMVQQHLGMVSKVKGLYVSDPTLAFRQQQISRNWSMLHNCFLKNDEGQVFSLASLSSLNVSNPRIRKAELMVRARGFEDCALDAGHEGVFLTLTCPSKYHCCLSRSGDHNPRWAGYNPKQGQEYLTKLFSRIRSALHKREIRPYGFRVCEPHHDGTPHWHLLLFAPAEQKEELLTIFRDYAFAEDGDEPGAKEHRFKVVNIDHSKGSATGYIAKYVSKNIDGSDLDDGCHGRRPQETAARVDAWATCWGIRQFQQIGGASVTVWREARRLTEAQRLSLPKQSQPIADSADASNWQGFTEAMGGAILPRRQRPAKPYYEELLDEETGELAQSLYEGEVLVRLKGLIVSGMKIITRIRQWTVVNSSQWQGDGSGRSPLHLEYCK
ncbi:replication endonuclease [Ferrimonas sediminum]|uniref:replication endonuclease n=1 Tax=Ferrimonas sediminum TaxID=718193 RepID=UPI0015A1FFC3|nr:replication endonuclease [Ferrimonas sediminum]